LLRVEHVLADVTFEDLDDQAAHRPAGGGDQLEQIGAILLFVQGALDGLDLSSDAPDSPDELFFAGQGV
jgi:hypothetical protein